jgi:hypothetical protein
MDGLALPAARLRIAAACPPFWRAALTAWSALQLLQPSPLPPWMPPTCAGLLTLRACSATATPATLAPALDSIAASGMQYISDFWDGEHGRLHYAQPVLQRSVQARRETVVPEQAAIHAYVRVRASITPGEAAAMRATPLLLMGGLYRVKGQHTCVRIRAVGAHGSSGCKRCETQRIATVQRVLIPAGRGPVPPYSHSSLALLPTMCSCSLSPLATSADHRTAWGEAETTALYPMLLSNVARDPPLTVDDSVAALRHFFRARMQPGSEQRPACEAVWNGLWPQAKMDETKWKDCWKAIQAAQLPGTHRSILWRMMHRQLPLLTLVWYRARLQLPETCVLCTTGQLETVEHLFNSCPVVSARWRWLNEWLQSVGIDTPTSLHSRLAGGCPTLLSADALVERWPPDSPLPPTSKRQKWFAAAWTEVRGVVIHAVWIARCRVVHAEATRRRAKEHIKVRINADLRSLIYRHVPHLCPWELPRLRARAEDHARFAHFFWKGLLDILDT